MKASILKILLTSILFSLSFLCYAQEFSSSLWHKGEVDLISGETLKGTVKYDLEGETLQVLLGDVIKSYSSDNVSSFQILDELSKRMRYFYALPFSGPDTYLKNHFFELLLEGEPYTLMGRERIVEKIDHNYDPYWGSSIQTRRLVMEHDFFLMDMYAKIIQVDTRKKEALLRFFRGKQTKIEAFIKVNKLNYKDKEDFIEIVNYYNLLRADDAIKAKSDSTGVN